MFRAITATQWKWTRGFALLATLAGFVVPVLSVQAAQGAIRRADDFVGAMQQFSVGYSLLAAGAGLMIALAAWGHDHRGRHVYALSLPIPRWKYALMRYGAGGLFLAAPVAGVLVGALVVAAVGGVPAGLHVYPIALTLRFAFAAGVAYSIFFAISASTAKTAGIVLGVIAGLFAAQVVLAMLHVRMDLLSAVGNAIFNNGGILSVFSGRWMLIDV
jgi:FtsH-binding integral membrane protein